MSANHSPGRASHRIRAVAVHIVRLPTWRALVLDGGPAVDDAVDLGVRWLAAAESA